MLATDTNEEALAIARSRPWPSDRVPLLRRDAYAPSAEAPAFDAGLTALWLSHVDRARMAGFLAALHSHLVPGARVFMFDERDAPERPLPASRLDAADNRYEMPRLASGERFEIVKNFYDESQLRRPVRPYADDVEVQTLTCFWTLAYATRGPRRQRPSKSRYGHRRSSSRVRSPSSRRSESRRWSSRRP